MAAKTKTVDGNDLHASDFAFVGDPQDVSTWKLPIHDEGHAQNAMSRFNQTQGIPANEKMAVAKKIAAKAKSFGIDTDEFEETYCGKKEMEQDARKRIEELRKGIPQRERRYIPAGSQTIELRSDGGDPKIGMFIPFESDSLDLGFTERIAPGAFTRTIKNGSGAKRNDVVALWNHDPNWVLGRQSNRTLRLSETQDGLDGEVTLDGKDAMHQHFARRVERRDVQGSSFGFETVRDEWAYDDEGRAMRTLLEVRLFDVSPVTYPAYPESGAEARSLAEIAAVKSGADLGELASLLRQVEHGKVPVEQRAALAAWVSRLGGMMPPEPAPAVDYAARLRLHERFLAI